MEVTKAFGKAIKMRRIQIDMTQETLANESGLARSFLSGIECGDKQATTLTVYRLATTLKTRPSELWKQTEQLMEQSSE